MPIKTEVALVQSLMLEFVNNMTSEGPESPKLDELLKANRGNVEFVRLAELARRLKRTAYNTADRFRTSDTGPGVERQMVERVLSIVDQNLKPDKSPLLVNVATLTPVASAHSTSRRS